MWFAEKKSKQCFCLHFGSRVRKVLRQEDDVSLWAAGIEACRELRELWSLADHETVQAYGVVGVQDEDEPRRNVKKRVCA